MVAPRSGDARLTRPLGLDPPGAPLRAKQVRVRQWYPVLVAILFCLDPYARYDISPGDGVRILLLTTSVAVVLTWMFVRWAGPDHGAAIAALTLVGILAGSDVLRLAAVGLAVGLVVVEHRMEALGRMHARIPWGRISEAVAVTLTVILGLQIVQAASLRLSEPRIDRPSGWSARQVDAQPDIFVLLADGHGRADVLASSYGYAMTELRGALATNGFREAPASIANHTITRWSLSVLFNGRPLAEMGQEMAAPANDLIPTVALRDSAVVAFLHRHGYRVIALDSGYGEVSIGGADEVISPSSLNELERAAARGTILGSLLSPDGQVVLEDQAQRVLAQMKALRTIAASPADAPLFVFAHVPAPHAPYVLDRQCGIRPLGYLLPAPPEVLDDVGRASRVAAEADQSACVDHLLAQTAAKIVAARPGAVVMVMSDHGPDELIDWAAPAEPGISNRVANLFWSRTPGRDGVFPDSVSLVNVFPLLFNAYFGTQLQVSPDDAYLGPLGAGGLFRPYEPGPAGPIPLPSLGADVTSAAGP